jgi:oligopeptidase B
MPTTDDDFKTTSLRCEVYSEHHTMTMYIGNKGTSSNLFTSLHIFVFLLSKIILFRSATALLVAPAARSAFATARPFQNSFTSTGKQRSWSRFTRSSSKSHSNSNSLSISSSMAGQVSPPVARREEDRAVMAGVAPADWKADLPRQSESSTEQLLDPAVPISDPYGWMRDESRESQEILDHLKSEMAYTTDQTSHLQGLRDILYKEMLATIQETDYTTPRPDGDWWYYTRSYEGKSYTVHCRAPKKTKELSIHWDGSATSPVMPNEEIVLDVNVLAKDQDYCATGTVKHSPSHKLLAYSTDLKGGETCQMYVQDLTSGEIVDHDPALEMDGSIRWGADDQTLFYLKMDAAHRPHQLMRRKIGSGAPDEMLLQENDDIFWMGISKSLDGRYLFVEASSKETTEVHYLDLHDSAGTLQCVAARRHNVLYDVEHRAGQWWIESNVGGLPNMALFTCPAIPNCADSWELLKEKGSGKVLFDGSYDPSLDGVVCFKGHVVASGRQGGIPRVWIIGLEDDDSSSTTAVTKFEMLAFPEEAYDVGLGSHHEFDADSVVVAYDSMVTPIRSLEIKVDDTSDRNVLKEKQVPGYDKELYACDRITVTSRDGKTEIPVSLVYRKDVMEEHVASGKPVPTHLYGYGSYGACMEADFSITRLPLLNRGMVYVIAHVRGGGEMGRQWYEEPNGAKVRTTP